MSDLVDLVWEPLELPNIELYETKLSEDIMEYLWKRIEVSKEVNLDWRDRLAGQISCSLHLQDKDDYFMDRVLFPIAKHMIDGNRSTFGPQFHQSFDEEKFQIRTDMTWWVNFQKQLEFNPQHIHSGILSFVIWMKIPTDWREQHELPFCQGTGGPAASDFQFLYTDIIGNHQDYTINMDKTKEGTMVVFPAKLGHAVFPFYNCDEERISIAGNVLWNVVPK